MALPCVIELPEQTPFPVENLPYGIFRPKAGGAWRAGTAIGDRVLDMAALEGAGLFSDCGLSGDDVFLRDSLNPFMAHTRPVWQAVRARLQALLTGEDTRLKDDDDLRARALIPANEVELGMPVEIGDYTDFYSSKHHAFNVGTMFRGPENALMPNYLHLPVAYHGRASSIVLSGVDVHRPSGQILPADADAPIYGPCRLFDFELEMGFFVGGPPTQLGTQVTVDEAEDRIFGFTLVNDWSARDIQKWEYQPLGPFNAKNFATSISPWIVTLEALQPFREAGPEQDPTPLPYLRGSDHWTVNIPLGVHLQAPGMDRPDTIVQSNFNHLYWTPAQQLAHHTVTGCNLRPGDLLASGTISGPEKRQRGSMLELAWRGTEPLELSNGESRKFIQDGDTVIMTAVCEGDGFRVGFGEVRSTLLPVREG